MKNDRQTMILEIISQENIETQEQLLARLQERGITSTQATISRDIKQMHLIKFLRDGKKLWYSLADDHVRTILQMGLEHVMCY